MVLNTEVFNQKHAQEEHVKHGNHKNHTKAIIIKDTLT